MSAVLRIPLIISLAIAVTLLLFFMMQTLIAVGVGQVEEKPAQRLADFLMPVHEMELIENQQKPEKPKPPEESPPELDSPSLDMNTPASVAVKLAAPKLGLDIKLGGIGVGTGDGEYLPLVRPPPVYPRNAQTRGIEGYVIIEFTVTEKGTVVDPVIIESEPRQIFDEAAKRAVLVYKYKPKMIDGAAVEVTGVRQKFTFKLNK